MRLLSNKSEDEKEAVISEKVFYRYKNKGRLKYYELNYLEYIKILRNICNVCMAIEYNNQITFLYFIDNVAPSSENI